ncbi:MAG: hypothetical protein JRD68_07600, partial [Deltaproteobacteria bacterium]|nr:hypothetical protein [Deltaproteobacteria bacterium]
MKQTRRNTRWLLWISALLILMIPAVSHALVAIGQNFEGLPATYNGEPDEGWQGNNYLATYYEDNSEVNLATIIVREIDGTRYLCTGWKNGDGDIPSSGSENRVTVTLSESSSLTWVYKKIYKFSVDVSPFERPMWGWGRNGDGVLGTGDAVGNEYQPVPAATELAADWTVVAGGMWNSYGIKKDGTLWVWGMNPAGEESCYYGPCSYAPIQYGTDTDWSFVTATEFYAMALKNDGTLWQWRHYDEQPSFIPPSSPQKVNNDADWAAVSAGSRHVLALKKDGTLWAWGQNPSGELGLGYTSGVVLTPTQVGTDNDWKDISATRDNSLALKKDGTLWSWGYGYSGEVGDGDRENVLVPKNIAPGTKWKAIGKGSCLWTAAAIRDDGTLWTWGLHYNGTLKGALGYLDNYDSQSSDYVVYPVQVGTDTDWIEVQGGARGAGSDHMIALKSDGTLWGWGYNMSGSLGIGYDSYFATPTRIGTDNDWVDFSMGLYHTLALKSPDRVRLDFSPHFGSQFLVEGETVSATARVQSFDGDKDYRLSSWNNGFGDIEPQVCSGTVQFDITQDSGLTWLYTTAETVSLTVGFAAGVPSQLAEAGGFNPIIGTYEMASGCLPLSLSAPAEVVIGTDRWVCTGWTATGLTSVDSGTGNTIEITDPANIGPEVTVQWIYQLESELPPTLTIHVDQADWTQADVAVSESGTVAGTWTNEKPVTETGNILSFEENDTLKLSAVFGFVDDAKTYKCIGLTINTPGYGMPIAQNVNGGRIEFVLVLRQNLDVTIKYSRTNEVSLGSPIPPLQDSTVTNWTDTDWQNHILNFEPGNPADTIDNSFFWDNTNKALYPVRPSPYFKVDWDGLGLGTPYQSVWAPAGQGGLVVKAPVNLQPDASDYTFEKVHISESYPYETWVLQDNIFQPLQAGRSLLQFSDKNGNPAFLTVEAVDFVQPTDSQPATIGTAMSETTHEDPDGKTGYVYNPMALYDGSGADKAYDRESRDGRIIPVNTENASDPDDDMVIIWYKKGVAGVAATIGWPVTTIKYDCQWPDDPETIVIA